MELAAGLLGLAFGWIWLMVVVVAAGVSLGVTGIWIWMLVEVLTRETDSDNNRLVWVLVVMLAGWVGAVIYLFVRRPQRIKSQGR